MFGIVTQWLTYGANRKSFQSPARNHGWMRAKKTHSSHMNQRWRLRKKSTAVASTSEATCAQTAARSVTAHARRAALLRHGAAPGLAAAAPVACIGRMLGQLLRPSRERASRYVCVI